MYLKKTIVNFLSILSATFFAMSNLHAASNPDPFDPAALEKICSAEIKKFKGNNPNIFTPKKVLTMDIVKAYKKLDSFNESLQESQESAGFKYKPRPGYQFILEEKQLKKCGKTLRSTVIPIIRQARISTISGHLSKPLPENIRKELLVEMGILSGQIYSKQGENGNENNYFDDFSLLFSIEYETDFPGFSEVSTENSAKQTGYEKEIQAMIESGKRLTESRKECGNIINENKAVNLNNVRDQSILPWCYAFAAADLSSYTFNKRLSAFSFMDQQSVGVILERYRWTKDIPLKNKKIMATEDGGNIEGAIELSQGSRNMCLESTLKSENIVFCGNKNYKEVLDEIKALKTPKQLSKNYCLQKNFKMIFNKIDEEELGWVIEEVNAKPDEENRMIELLVEKQCWEDGNYDEREDAWLGVGKSTRGFEINESDEIFRHFVNSELNAGRVVAISYHARNILDVDISDGEPDGHASLIVGSRKVENSCEYLIRNSHGKSCNLKKIDGLSCHQNCSSGLCNNSGHFWIRKENLEKSLVSITELSGLRSKAKAREKY